MFKDDLWVKYVLSGMILLLTGYLFYGRIWVGLLLLPFLRVFRKIFLADRAQRNMRLYLKGYCDFLQIVENGLAAGLSLEHTLVQAEKELTRSSGKHSEIVEDITEVNRRIALHTPIESCLTEWAQNKGIEEMTLFAGIVSSGRRRGGNLNRMIRQTAESISKRIELEEEIQTMLSGKLMEYRIMCLVPLGILAYVRCGSKDYFEAMYTSPGGLLFMTGCLGLYAVGVWLGGKWIKVRV